MAGEVAPRPVSTAAGLCRPGPGCPPARPLALSPSRPLASDPALTHHVREGGGGRSRWIGAVLEVRVVARRGSREGSGASVGRECGARRRAAELIRAGPRNDAGAVCGARVERQRGGRLVQVALRVGHGHTRAWGAPRRGGQRAGRRPARASERAGTWPLAAPGRSSSSPGSRAPARGASWLASRAPPAATAAPAPLRAPLARARLSLPPPPSLALCTGGLCFWLCKGPAKMLSWKLRILTPCARAKLLLPGV